MDARAFLDVEHSIMGRRWTRPGADVLRMGEGLAQQARLPLPLGTILAQRGVTPETVQGYLSPVLRDLLPDPRSLKDMPKAAERFIRAVTQKERIAIFADYDVDGGSSAALLLTWLRHVGHDATLYIPDRIDEGYGPNIPAMQTLGAAHDLIICVDCGTLSHEAIGAAGCDVIVLDHHLGAETLPPAVAVVNPNRQDEDHSLSHLCAAAVVFLMLVEVNRCLREGGLSLAARAPDLMAMLDLVALASVADVAPLIGVNRAFVRQGLKVMARRLRPGICALSDGAGLREAPNSYALGFVLGPRINAGGRVGQADLGARLLASDDPGESAAIAVRLETLNDERRAITEAVRLEAMAQAEARGTDGPLVWAAGEGWHPGVVGIVAARLKEATNRPAVVIGFDAQGEGKGSGRSVAGVDLGAAVQHLAQEGLLSKGGGHPMATGLSLSRDQLEEGMERLGALLARQGAGAQLGPRALHIDGLLMPSAATIDLVEVLEQAGPFGQASPAPRFAFADVNVQTRRLGERHLKLSFGASDGHKVEAIAFGAFDTPLGPALENSGHRRFHLAGRLEINRWGAKSRVQLKLEDAAPV